MLRRCDRDEVDCRVHTDLAQRPEDRGESAFPHLGAESAGVEPHVRRPRLAHASHDRLGDHVTRCQVHERVLPLHEAHTVVVAENSSFAAYGLAHERLLTRGIRAEPEHGRVELNELEVGHRGAGAQRGRHPVTRRHRGVGGLAEDLPETTCRKHHRGGEHCADTVALALPDDVEREPLDGTRLVEEKVEGHGVLDDLDTGATLDCGDECA